MIYEKIIYDLLEDDSFRRYVLYGEYAEKWDMWRKDHRGYNQEMELASMIMKNLYQENSDIIINLKKNDVKNSIKSSLLNELDTKVSKKRFVFWKVAAVLMILFASLPVIYYVQNKFSNIHTQQVSDVQKVIKQNPKGIKSIITFSDGSKAYLNAESKLIYSQIFSEGTREVELEGEAYFEVTKDEKRPFIIHAGEVGIKVLGTSFNVTAYPENPFINIALVSGTVSVNIHDGENVLLSPAEMLNYSLTGNKSHKVVSFISEDIVGWKDGILSFRDEPVKDIFNKLERWYGVEIVYDRANQDFSNWIFTGKFENRSLEYILNTMNYQNIFEFKIEDSKIIIRK